MSRINIAFAVCLRGMPGIVQWHMLGRGSTLGTAPSDYSHGLVYL